MPTMPWFRVYSDILSDKKIKHISDKLQEPKALTIGIWIIMLAIANNSEDRGNLLITSTKPYSVDDLVDETGVNVIKINDYLEEFKTWEMINWDEYIAIRNWKKRQFRSDFSTSRVEKYRNKETEPDPEPEEKPKKKKTKPTEYPILADGLPEWVSEPLRAICRAFQEESGITTPAAFNTDWNKSLLELSAMNATPDVIAEAVKRLRKNKMTVIRPGGAVGTVKSILAEDRSTETKYDADGNEVRL